MNRTPFTTRPSSTSRQGMTRLAGTAHRQEIGVDAKPVVAAFFGMELRPHDVCARGGGGRRVVAGADHALHSLRRVGMHEIEVGAVLDALPQRRPLDLTYAAPPDHRQPGAAFDRYDASGQQPQPLV